MISKKVRQPRAVLVAVVDDDDDVKSRQMVGGGARGGEGCAGRSKRHEREGGEIRVMNSNGRESTRGVRDAL